MSHAGHGSTSSGTRGLGIPTNHALALDYWYITAGVVGFLGLVRGVNYLESRRRYLFLVLTNSLADV